jgi:hypothetical protein
MRISLWLAAFAAVSLLSAVPASADVTVHMKVNGEPVTLLAEEHKLRFDGLDQLTIFRGDKKVLWAADLADKTYTEMTEEDMKSAGQQLDAAMSQIEEAMKNMPPEQRAAVEAMMKKGQPAAPKSVVKPTGESKTVNGFVCRGYIVTDDHGVTEVWAADPKAVSLAAADLAAFNEFANFMQTMLPGMDQVGGFIKDYDHPREGEVPGIPVASVRKNTKGKVVVTTELVKVEKGDVPSAQFEVPAGFKKESNPARPKGASDSGNE